MSAKAFSRVRFHANHGCAQELGDCLHEVASQMSQVPGCLRFAVDRDGLDDHCWVTTVHWETEHAMHQHLEHTSGPRFENLLQRGIVRHMEFDTSPTPYFPQ